MTDYGDDFMCIVKTNPKGFCKYTIKNLVDIWPGGYFLVFKRHPIVTSYFLLLTIGYKYNYKKIISIIAIHRAGIAKYSIHHLYKYPD